jgi:hypothetical protein
MGVLVDSELNFFDEGLGFYCGLDAFLRLLLAVAVEEDVVSDWGEGDLPDFGGEELETFLGPMEVHEFAHLGGGGSDLVAFFRVGSVQ